MNRILVLTAYTASFTIGALGQNISVSSVPHSVMRTFQARYSTVKKVEWKIKPDKNYEAEFTAKGTDIAVKFDSTGKWLETESAALRSGIPRAVRDSIALQFKRYKIIEVQTVERWNEKQFAWEIHLEGSKEVVKALFHDNGTMISRSSKPIAGKIK